MIVQSEKQSGERGKTLSAMFLALSFVSLCVFVPLWFKNIYTPFYSLPEACSLQPAACGLTLPPHER
jgi:hypothetical protein